MSDVNPIQRASRAGLFVVDSPHCGVRPSETVRVNVAACPCELRPLDGCPLDALMGDGGEGHVTLLDAELRIAYMNRPPPRGAVEDVLGLRMWETYPHTTFGRGAMRRWLEAGVSGDHRVDATTSAGEAVTWLFRGTALPGGAWRIHAAIAEAASIYESGTRWAPVVAAE